MKYSLECLSQWRKKESNCSMENQDLNQYKNQGGSERHGMFIAV